MPGQETGLGMEDGFLAGALTQLQTFRANELVAVGGKGFLVLMLVSLAASLFISGLYLVFYQNRATGTQLHRVFPLLGISITTLFVAIQFSLPLSLGLLGALSIVRFRTPIKEPEEIGFLMLLIAASIATATANVKFLVILLAVATAALTALRYAPWPLRDALQDAFVSVALPAGASAQDIENMRAVVMERLPGARLHSLNRGAAGVTLGYAVSRLKDDAVAPLQTAVETANPEAELHVHLNRSGTF